MWYLSPEPNHDVHTHLPKFYDKLKFPSTHALVFQVVLFFRVSTYALVFQVVLFFRVSEETFVNISPL